MAAQSDKYLKYRGDVTAMVGLDTTLAFTTVHPEGQPTALYRVDLEKGTLAAAALPCGGRALIADDDHLYLAGTDKRLYRAPKAGGDPQPLGDALGAAVIALAPLCDEQLAALVGSQIHILSRADGAVQYSLDLPEAGTAIASDPEGRWLVAGTEKGTLIAFDREDKPRLLAGGSTKAHSGAVSGLCFEPDELRVMSAGADGRMLSTHVRGTLEPEERGGRGGHSGKSIIALGLEDKAYTGGDDGGVKIWTIGGGNKRPSSLKDTLRPVVALAQVTYKDRPHLAVVSEDNAIRLFIQDATGKLEHRSTTLRDAYAWARRAFKQKEVSARQEALKALAEFNDAKAIELLTSRASEDDDHPLRVLATTLLGESGNRRAIQPLEGLLRANTEKVRRAALDGLRALEGQADLRPLNLALQARQADIGVEAVQALGALSSEDEQALSRLVEALNDQPEQVRFAALEILEGVHGDDPYGTLIGLQSKRADVRWRALLRCHQRDLLNVQTVRSAIRRALEDGDESVRLMAFDVSLLGRPTLAGALRHLDKSVHRRLYQIETHGEAIDSEAALPKTKAVKINTLGTDDYVPLLEAMACEALDACVRGAVHLAQLQDPRAFGTLLQLTRVSEDGARVEACRALEALGDPRGIQRLRLMLRDGAAQVRDAAFTALSRLLSDAPLDAASAGLQAEHEDVRRRGLSLLLKQLKKAQPKDLEHPAYRLLERALNDAGQPIRGEAFKGAINLQVMGGGPATLRFTLKSLHPDIRREVLTEVMGEIAQPWAWEMLLDLFDDPDSALRLDAFAFAQKKGKGRGVAPLARGQESAYADVRLKAVQALAKKYTGETAPLLAKALSDDEAEVRAVAIDALKLAEDGDALIEAMGSDHWDVRIQAAAARAVVGDAAARDPLLDQLRSDEPEVSDLKAIWRKDTLVAFQGLAALSDPATAADLVKHLTHEDAEIRKGAAEALAWADSAEDPAALKATLRHGDAEIRMIAALGLARLGDDTGASLLFAHHAGDGDTGGSGGRRRATRRSAAPTYAGASAESALVAALTLDAEDIFLSYLDHRDDTIRQRALILLLMMEWRENDGVPDRCLAALASADPRVRLAGATALEHFSDLDAFGAHVVSTFNDRGEHTAPWKISEDTIRQIAEIVTFGPPRLKARAVEVLKGLDGKKQGGFDRLWRIFSTRHSDEIAALEKAAKKRKAAKTAYDHGTIMQMVFGAYTGLSRDRGAPISTRQQALNRIRAMVEGGQLDLASAAPIFVQQLSNSGQLARKAAFEALVALKHDGAIVAAESLATGIADVGVMALELLAAQGGAAEGRRVLLEVLKGKDNGLEYEAVKLLEKAGQPADAWAEALEARSSRLRQSAVARLLQLASEDQPGALGALKKTLASPFADVRREGAISLAQLKISEAYAPLIELLRADRNQAQIIRALATLGDGRTPEALLDRIHDDPAGDARLGDLYGQIGLFRDPAIFDRLIGDLDHKARRNDAFDAALTITGYDQRVEVDLDEVDATGIIPTEWQARQHPRHHELYAQLMEIAGAKGNDRWINRLLSAAAWSPDGAVSVPLAQLAASAKPEIRRGALMAIAWRLRHRDGAADPLLTALEHKDPDTQFHGAEGLALAGRAEGISVLLASVDLLEDLRLRRRAVIALGKLGDPRALDLLLRLVNEEGHALQEQAAEAIGHLGTGEHRARILKILKSLAKEGDGVAEYALTGLRWIGDDEAWTFIRGRVDDEDWSIRAKVCELLGHHDDPASREALIKQLIKDDDWDVASAAAQSLRAQFGPESLEPDYAFVQSENGSDLEDDTLKRLCERGDPARLMALMPKLHEDLADEYQPALVNALLTRDPMPVEAAGEALSGAHDRTVEVAARILGRAGDAAYQKPVAEAAAKALADWRDLERRLNAARDGDWSLEQRLTEATDRGAWLLWACGRLKAGVDVLIEAAGLQSRASRPLRKQALTALASGLGKAKGLDALVQAAQGPDAALRTLAATAVAKLDAKKAATLVEGALDDRPALDRLLKAQGEIGGDALRQAAGHVHRQGVVLPHLVARGDVEALGAALADKTLKAEARLGAMEALARIAGDPVKAEAAEAPILAVAKNDKEDEDMRKAAWRALRRARRARAQREVRS